jgi:undecaprenyl-diphosphatase
MPAFQRALTWVGDACRVDTLIAVVAQYAVFLIPLGAAFAWWRASRPDKVAMATAGVVTLVLALLAIALMGDGWADPRPFAVDGRPPLVAHVADNGFPSDHMTIGTAVAATVWRWRRRLGALLLGVAVLVGAARVAARIHHVPDIVGGLLIGMACAAVGVLVSRRTAGHLARRRRSQVATGRRSGGSRGGDEPA